jgi:hypothetical protein
LRGGVSSFQFEVSRGRERRAFGLRGEKTDVFFYGSRVRRSDDVEENVSFSSRSGWRWGSGRSSLGLRSEKTDVFFYGGELEARGGRGKREFFFAKRVGMGKRKVVAWPSE